jgi:uncharacterized membrane protein
MKSELLAEIWQLHSGKIVGMVMGLFIGILILVFGFFHTMFVIVCMIAGYIVGKRIDEKEDIMDILGKLLPPGYHRQ